MQPLDAYSACPWAAALAAVAVSAAVGVEAAVGGLELDHPPQAVTQLSTRIPAITSGGSLHAGGCALTRLRSQRGDGQTMNRAADRSAG